MNRCAHSRIRAATADIGHVLINICVRGPGNSFEQGRRGHEHSRLTVPALWNIHFDPQLLQRMTGVRAQSLDRGNARAGGRCERELAGADRLPINVHRTSAALSDTTTEFRACHSKMITQHPQQWRRGIGIHLERLAIHFNRCAHVKAPRGVCFLSRQDSRPEKGSLISCASCNYASSSLIQIALPPAIAELRLMSAKYEFMKPG